MVTLREHDVFDIGGESSSKPYVPVDTDHMQAYIDNKLATIIYHHENDDLPDRATLKQELENASALMKERMEWFGISSSVYVLIELFGEKFKFTLNFQKLR